MRAMHLPLSPSIHPSIYRPAALLPSPFPHSSFPPSLWPLSRNRRGSNPRPLAGLHPTAHATPHRSAFQCRPHFSGKRPRPPIKKRQAAARRRPYPTKGGGGAFYVTSISAPSPQQPAAPLWRAPHQRRCSRLRAWAFGVDHIPSLVSIIYRVWYRSYTPTPIPGICIGALCVCAFPPSPRSAALPLHPHPHLSRTGCRVSYSITSM